MEKEHKILYFNLLTGEWSLKPPKAKREDYRAYDNAGLDGVTIEEWTYGYGDLRWQFAYTKHDIRIADLRLLEAKKHDVHNLRDMIGISYSYEEFEQCFGEMWKNLKEMQTETKEGA